MAVSCAGAVNDRVPWYACNPAIALLLAAMLLGNMLLFSSGFAIFVLRQLQTDIARSPIRKAFTPYHLLVIVVSALAGLAAFPTDRL